MKVRNLFLHIFIDSQTLEWRSRVLSFDFLLFLEQADKKYWLIEQKRSDLDNDANDGSEEGLNEMPINMITGHTYSAISWSVGIALYVFPTQIH